eukprot:2549990-Amphidinium_carterae.1
MELRCHCDFNESLRVLVLRPMWLQANGWRPLLQLNTILSIGACRTERKRISAQLRMPSLPLYCQPLEWVSATIAVALSQKVMAEISQTIKSVIRLVIRVTTMRNHRK